MVLEEVIDTIKYSITNYFEKFEIGFVEVLPLEYRMMAVEKLPFFEYTAIIDFGGSYNGFLYVSATEECLNVFLKKYIKNPSTEYLLDSVSELANVIAGNIGKVLKKKFDISVPYSREGSIADKISGDVFFCIIPIRFNGRKGCLVFHLGEK